MKLQVYVVKDRATEVFGTPMFMISNGQAVRSFTDEVNRADKDNQLYTHPDDFDLHVCGQWDNESGSFDVTLPRVLARGKDVSTKLLETN